jgi:hypothetical protein
MTADSLYSSNALLGAGGVAQVAEYMLSELEALNCPQYHQKKKQKKEKRGKETTKNALKGKICSQERAF